MNDNYEEEGIMTPEGFLSVAKMEELSRIMSEGRASEVFGDTSDVSYTDYDSDDDYYDDDDDDYSYDKVAMCVEFDRESYKEIEKRASRQGMTPNEYVVGMAML